MVMFRRLEGLPPVDEARPISKLLRVVLFVCVLVLVAGGGLIYDYARPAVYRATARISVDPPGLNDAAAKAQFVVSEAQAMRRSDLMTEVADRIKASAGDGAVEVADLERGLTAEPVAQTTVIELRADGKDRAGLVAALTAWIDAYMESRKATDQSEGIETAEDAKHAVKTAKQAVDDKRREMDAFRRQHGIISIERDENPSAARLRGLHTALNDAATREVNAEAKLKAITDGIAKGEPVNRVGDRAALSNLEMRAVDLRERLKEFEHDYTPQYLSHDPKYKSVKSNLARVEQQLEDEKKRFARGAQHEAQEEYASAQRAAKRIRDQIDGLKAESQQFATRFVELKRMATELELLQETRRTAVEQLSKIESARKPSAVRIRLLSAPLAEEKPIAPNYTRDATIAVAAGLILAIAAVWILDYLRRDPDRSNAPSSQPIIQIAYPMLQAGQTGPAATPALGGPPAGLLGVSQAAASMELTTSDVAALWGAATADGRLILAAVFSGIASSELTQLRWKDIDVEQGSIEIAGASARKLPLLPALRQSLMAKTGPDAVTNGDSLLLADGAGNSMDEAAVDAQLTLIAHDAGLRHPEEITGRSLHFTYAAFLARQGMRMSDLVATVGRFTAAMGSQLVRLAPPGQVRSADSIDRIYPSFRTV